MDRLAKFRAMARRVRTSTTVALWVCTLASIGLFIGSFMVPPLGAIDPSVLKGGAVLFAFAAKTFKVMRIGADYDIYMRRRNTLCINYDTATIVYADM